MNAPAPQTAVARCVAALAGRQAIAPGEMVELRGVQVASPATSVREWFMALPGQAVVSTGYTAAAVGGIGAIGLRVNMHTVDEVRTSGKLTLRCPEVVRLNLTGEGADPLSGVDVLLDAARRVGAANIKGRALEVSGTGLGRLWMDERAALAQAAQCLGFEFAFVTADERVLANVREHTGDPFETWIAQHGAHYAASADVTPARLLSQTLLDDGTVFHAGELSGTCVRRVVLAGVFARATGLSRIAAMVRGRSMANGLDLLVRPFSPVDEDVVRDDGTLSDLEKFGAKVLKPGAECLADGQRCDEWTVHTCPLTWHQAVERAAQAKSGARHALVGGELAAACALAGEFKHPVDTFAAIRGDSKVSTRRQVFDA